MTAVIDTLLVLHFIGVASLLGGFLGQMTERDKHMTMGMLHGVLLQIVTGVGLVWAEWGTEDARPDAMVAVKMGIALVVLFLVVRHLKMPRIPTPLWAITGGLVVANIVVAVVWR